MVHAVYFDKGKACSYANHQLRTPKLAAEQATGYDAELKVCRITMQDCVQSCACELEQVENVTFTS